MDFKARARAYFTAVNAYDAAAIERMVDEDYVQHNPFVATGRAAFVALLPKLKAHGSRIRNLRMLQDGRHVVMHHRWENAAPFGHDEVDAFHVIRFDADSRIAEHWSVMAEASPSHEGATPIADLDRTEANKARASELFPYASPDLAYRTQHKVFGEGNLCLSVSEGLRLGVPSAIYDLLRFEDGRLAERWRIVQEIPTTGLANENTMFGF